MAKLSVAIIRSLIPANELEIVVSIVCLLLPKTPIKFSKNTNASEAAATFRRDIFLWCFSF